jgi:hypothetical protein
MRTMTMEERLPEDKLNAFDREPIGLNEEEKVNVYPLNFYINDRLKVFFQNANSKSLSFINQSRFDSDEKIKKPGSIKLEDLGRFDMFKSRLH